MTDQSPNRWTSFELTFRAFQMIAAHWKTIFIVMIPVYAVQWGPLYFFERLSGGPAELMAGDDLKSFFRVWFAILAFALIWAVGGAFLAVLWHRLVLRPAKFWPPLSALGWYLWQALKLILLLMVSGWILLGVFSFFSGGVSPYYFAIFWLFGILASVAFTYFWVRLGLVLPASAVENKDMTLVFSWFETKEASWSIIVLALVEGILWAAIDELTYWAGLPDAYFFLSFLPVLFGLAALSVLYQDLETRTEPA